MYQTESYTWIPPDSDNRAGGTNYDPTRNTAVSPPPSDQLTRKPYVPPTKITGDDSKPFGDVLDPPLM